jgi:hypothetical protein
LGAGIVADGFGGVDLTAIFMLIRALLQVNNSLTIDFTKSHGIVHVQTQQMALGVLGVSGFQIFL